MMARATCAVYWFHPLAWFADRRCGSSASGPATTSCCWPEPGPGDYAGHLLEIARGLRVPRTAALAALAMARPSQLEGRLRAILDPARLRRGPGRFLTTIAVLAALVARPAAPTPRRASSSAAIPVAARRRNWRLQPTRPRMTLTGRLLDPAGKPVPGGAVMVIVRPKYSSRPMLESAATGAMTAYEGRCDGSGEFRIELPRTSSRGSMGSRSQGWRRATVLADGTRSRPRSTGCRRGSAVPS